jgi:stringent starvation protein B
MRYDVSMSVSDLTPSPSSTRPYLLRALYEWCTDNGYTPYIAAYVDETVQVPREHVKNNEIVLNISMDATSSLKLGNDFIEFKARFSGSAREIMVPIDRVIAIYARENGQGMAFPVPQTVPVRGFVTQPQADIAPSQNEALHLHSAQDNTTPEHAAAAPKVVQLVAVTVDATTTTDDEPPTPPAGGAAAGHAPATRPSLKRVK